MNIKGVSFVLCALLLPAFNAAAQRPDAATQVIEGIEAKRGSDAVARAARL